MTCFNEAICASWSAWTTRVGSSHSCSLYVLRSTRDEHCSWTKDQLSLSWTCKTTSIDKSAPPTLFDGTMLLLLRPKKCQRFQWKVLSSHAATCQWFPGIWSVQWDWQPVVGLCVGVEHMGPHLVVLVVQQLDLLFSLLTFLSQDFWGPSGVQTPSYPPPRRKSVPKRTCFKHILR